MPPKRKRTASFKSEERGKKTPPASPLTPTPSPEVVDESPVSIAILKTMEDMQRFEESEDCFILGFDPSEPVPLSQPQRTARDDDDLSVIAEKGQVACRDYPHSRHLCVKFPFKTTPHEKHCEQCYCYVCDSAAPCRFWTLGLHCNAESADFWKQERDLFKKLQDKKL